VRRLKLAPAATRSAARLQDERASDGGNVVVARREASQSTGMTLNVSSIARVLTAFGVLSLLFGLFQASIGNVSERRSQRTLRGAFQQVLSSGVGLGRDAKGHSHPIAKGSPVAFLEIARIGIRKVVIEGADSNSLKKGPGLVVGSSIPGQPGQSTVLGRRTTFGSPFRHLDVLAVGDEIKVTTPYGTFHYRVRETHKVDAGKALDFAPATGSLLTLVTSDPPYIGGSALVIAATLEGQPSTFQDPQQPSASNDKGSVALAGNAGSVPRTLFFGVLVLAALVATDKLYRQWRRWPTYLLTTPIILALLFAWMESLVSLFPSSL
jgi:sortase A